MAEKKSSLTGYDLSRKWFDFCFENPEKISPIHTALYFFIMEHCNRLGWKQKFGLPTTMSMEAIGIRSYNTYKKALYDIIEWGFLVMIESSKNQYSANIVALSNFDKALYKALDKALIKHGTKHCRSTVQSIDSIDKQVNKEQLTRERGFTPPTKEDVISVMSEKLDEFTAMGEAEKFMNYYESVGWLIKNKKMKKWEAAAAGWISRMKNFNNGTHKQTSSSKSTGAEQLLSSLKETIGAGDGGFKG